MRLWRRRPAIPAELSQTVSPGAGRGLRARGGALRDFFRSELHPKNLWRQRRAILAGMWRAAYGGVSRGLRLVGSAARYLYQLSIRTVDLWRQRRAALAEPWRAVPQLSLLESRGGTRQQLVTRAALVTLLLVGGYLLQNSYREGNTIRGQLDSPSAQLKSTQQELAARVQEVERLEDQLEQLQQRISETESVHQWIGSIKWEPTMAALKDLQSTDIEFRSLAGNADGRLTLVAVVSGEQSLANLQRHLHEPNQPFSLQDVRWERREEGLALTAILQVREIP